MTVAGGADCNDFESNRLAKTFSYLSLHGSLIKYFLKEDHNYFSLKEKCKIAVPFQSSFRKAIMGDHGLAAS